MRRFAVLLLFLACSLAAIRAEGRGLDEPQGVHGHLPRRLEGIDRRPTEESA